MKRCTEKEKNTCRVERLGCKGCYYNSDYSLEDLKKQNEWAYNYIVELENKLKELEIERDYYKKMYLDFNNYFIKN